jgi:uncharacterized secreted repeat protein (TIGR03808 family)
MEQTVRKLHRRGFFAVTAAGAAAFAQPAIAGDTDAIKMAMRGSLDATELGIVPGALDDQSRKFSRMLETASDRDMPVFLPPSTYVVSNLNLPRSVRLSGVPGASRIIYGGDGHLFLAEKTELLHLDGLLIDGANRWIGEQAQGLIDARGVPQLVIDNCRILGSGKNGIALERVAGRVERCEISGAADAGIFSVEGAGLQIAGNTVAACGNGGILVHRWQVADDGTIITGNRVSNTRALGGGTGQNGNGINIFRANGVTVANNHVSDSGFSAIRGNSASNLQINGNTCLNSGETAIYAEFGFEGAVINANIVDGAANGISIVNFDDGGRMGVCSGNLIRNLRKEGPYTPDPPGWGTGISVEADTSITGNVIENAPRFGITLGWGKFLRNVIANGNVIRQADVGIAVSVVEGVGAAVITDNLIDGAKSGGIVGYRWVDAATDDLAKSPPGGGNLIVERNHVS